MFSELLKSVDKGAYYAFSEMVNGATRNPQPWVEVLDAGRWVGSLYGAVAFLALACVLLLAQARVRATLIAIAVFALGLLCGEAIGLASPIPRPENAARMLDGGQMLHSFPAGDVLTFSLAGALVVYAAWGMLRGWQSRTLMVIAVVTLVLWVAMSEIMLVLHFVTDVAAGLFCGLALALLATRLAARSPQSLESP